MGCCFATLRRSLILGDDEEKVIERNLELQWIADSYSDTIIPSIKVHLAAVVQWLDDLLSVVAIIRRSHTFNENKKKKKRRCKVNVYNKIVAHELNELMLFPSYLALGTLEETMCRLRLQMGRISKRQRSMKRWRRVCTAVVMAVAVGMLIASIGLALAGAGPVAITAAASGATAIKAVEPLANAALEEEERKLKEEKEVVEMMRDGEQLMVQEFNGVRRLTKEMIDKYLNFVEQIKAAEKAAPETEKMIDEIESDAMEIKGKINLYRYKIEQFEIKFNRMIKIN